MIAFFTVEDLTGPIEGMLLPEGYEKAGSVLAENAIVVVWGRAEMDERWREEREGGGRYRLIAEAVVPLGDGEAVARMGNGLAARNNSRGMRRAARPPANSAPREDAVPNEARSAPPAGRVHIRVPSAVPPETMGKLRDMIGQFRGDTEVFLHLQLEEEERRVRLGRDYLVRQDEAFTQAVQELLGEGTIWVE
jgi:hypothetical protein